MSERTGGCWPGIRGSSGASTGLFVLAGQRPVFGAWATHPVVGAWLTPGIREGLVPVVFGPIIPVLTLLVGFAAVVLLHLRPSGAFFRLPGSAQALRQAQMVELARIRSSSARWTRQV